MKTKLLAAVLLLMGVSAGAQEPEPVDLGLSVMWADRNVGAKNPWDEGVPFAWGETEPKKAYSWETYLYYDDAKEMLTKYRGFFSYSDDALEAENGVWTVGHAANLSVLQSSDDAAQCYLPGEFKVPSMEDYWELVEKCTWKKTKEHNREGYRIIGPNGNSIFLPIVHVQSHHKSDRKKKGVFYWLSRLEYDDMACVITPVNEDQHFFPRYVGLPIRPVAITDKDEMVYSTVESMPEFPGGSEELSDYLSKKVIIPTEAQEEKPQRRHSICQFVVREDGSISDVEIVRSAGDASLDAEAVRVISNMPKWIPGLQRGKAVNVKLSMPIHF